MTIMMIVEHEIFMKKILMMEKFIHIMQFLFFLKQSNKLIFSFPNNKNTWNEIAKYNIFNWNELLKLKKITTEPQPELKILSDVKKYIENIKNKKDIKNRILPIINKTAKLDKKINIFDYAKQ